MTEVHLNTTESRAGVVGCHEYNPFPIDPSIYLHRQSRPDQSHPPSSQREPSVTRIYGLFWAISRVNSMVILFENNGAPLKH